MTTWIKDDNGNKCSVEYFGSKEAAQKALGSLKNCKDCTNCYGCSDCSRCSRCSGCSDCSDCSGCSGGKNNIKLDGSIKIPDVPVLENIHSKVYAVASQKNALDMSIWHKNGNFCGTTHCRAGWVNHLCGDAGKALEEYWGANHAAWLIYRKSDPSIVGKRPNFFASNEDALADMKRLAELEAE